MIRKLVVEAIGTFFLVLTIGLVLLGPGAGPLSPLPVGAVLVAMVYAGAHVSGAHYNPAVTLSVLLRGQATAMDLAGYWVVQIAAGAAAALTVVRVHVDAEPVAFVVPVGSAFLGEFLFTFALVYVILNVGTARGTKGNSYFGVAIGLTVVAAAYAIGGISGAALNPAVALGLVLMDLITARSLWVLAVGELLGGVAAAVVFMALDLGLDKATTATPAEQAALRPQAAPGG